MLVEVGDEEEPVENRYVVGFSFPIAVTPGASLLGIDLCELEKSFSIGFPGSGPRSESDRGWC
jgi:hypothetical protein